MHSTFRALSSLALMSLAGTASAQPGGPLYASGLAHTPVGQAQLGPVEGRRLPVRNLGSSGEDGVEVQLASAGGGSVSVDAGDLGQTTARHRTKYKGWDGTVKGHYEARGNGDGTISGTLDFSGMGAVAIEYTVRDEAGNAVGTGVIDGPTLEYGLSSWSCPSGYYPYWIYTWYQDKFGTWKCQVTFGGCLQYLVSVTNLGSVEVFMGGSSMDLRVVGSNGDNNPGPLGSIEVTGDGLTELAVQDESIRTLGAECYGTGEAHLAEECIGVPPPCAAGTSALAVHNIGSSGQDGVEIRFPRASSMSFDYSLGDILMSPVPGSARASIKGAIPGGVGELTHLDVLGEGGIGHIRPDFSGMGSSQYRITLLDDSGLTIGEHVADNGVPFDCQIICVGSVPVWGWVWCPVQCAGSPTYVWRIVGCEGTVGTGVDWGNGWQNARTVEISPVDPTVIGDPTGVAFRGRDLLSGMEISHFQTTDRCPADYNNDGFVSGDDFDGYVLAFETGDPSADFNNDGFISGDDFDAYVLAFETGC